MVFGITKNHHQDLPQHQQYATAPSSTADHHAAHSFVMFACKSGSPIPAFKSAICFLHLQMRLQHATEGKKPPSLPTASLAGLALLGREMLDRTVKAQKKCSSGCHFDMHHARFSDLAHIASIGG